MYKIPSALNVEYLSLIQKSLILITPILVRIVYHIIYVRMTIKKFGYPFLLPVNPFLNEHD